MAPKWIWDARHGDHYYVTYDNAGKPVYHWGKDVQSTSSGSQRDTGAGASARSRGDSATILTPDSNTAQMPEPIPSDLRRSLPDLIPGTPEVGWYEELDDSYRMRTGQEAHQFFRVGRVFAMLWAEPAGETRNARVSSEFTVGRFGQTVYSNIRRFVIMKAKPRDHYVYACPITTYSGRGTRKRGCRPSEHTIVYFKGTDPNDCYIPGEWEGGMQKEPIEVEPSEVNVKMDKASRIRFGKTFPVEWNVKVKEIGKVNPEHMSKLLQYWKEEEYEGSPDDDEGEANAAAARLQPARTANSGHSAQYPLTDTSGTYQPTTTATSYAAQYPASTTAHAYSQQPQQPLSGYQQSQYGVSQQAPYSITPHPAQDASQYSPYGAQQPGYGGSQQHASGGAEHTGYGGSQYPSYGVSQHPGHGGVGQPGHGGFQQQGHGGFQQPGPGGFQQPGYGAPQPYDGTHPPYQGGQYPYYNG